MESSKCICYFGSFDPDYSRNRIIRTGLEENGFLVINCQSYGVLPIRIIKLAYKFIKLKKSFSSIIVGFPGWFDLPLAFLLGKLFNKKVFFDVFTPMYESYFLDRQQVKAGWFYFFVDWLNFKLADIVIADTKTHLNNFVAKYGLNKNKGVVVYLGSDNRFFKPKVEIETTDVLFYGSYQPLQGVEHIIRVALQLRKNNFKLIGKGQTRTKIESMVKDWKVDNVEFLDWILLSDLAKEISKAKIVLGIFGSSEKALSVIPNKVYDGISCKKLVITKKTPATLELFKSAGCVLVEDDNQLVKEIKFYLKNKKSRLIKSKQAYAIYLKKLQPRIVVRPILSLL